MIFTRHKLKTAAVRNSVVPPQAIIDNFREDIKVQRDFHYAETERLRSVIEDATARLGNHMVALEECERVLANVGAVQALTISNLDFSLDETEQKLVGARIRKDNETFAEILGRHNMDAA